MAEGHSCARPPSLPDALIPLITPAVLIASCLAAFGLDTLFAGLTASAEAGQG